MGNLFQLCTFNKTYNDPQPDAICKIQSPKETVHLIVINLDHVSYQGYHPVVAVSTLHFWTLYDLMVSYHFLLGRGEQTLIAFSLSPPTPRLSAPLWGQPA